MKPSDEVSVNAAPGGCTLAVRVRPRASRPGIAGVREGALELRVSSPPVEGEANAATRDLLARILGVPRARVSLAGGGKSRRKTFRVEGLAPEEARARIAAARETP